MNSLKAAILVVLATLGSTAAFASQPRALLVQQQTAHSSKRPLICFAAADGDNDDSTTPSSDDNDEGNEAKEIVPSLENSVIPPPSTPQPKRLDPLVQSLTRMDAETANAKTVQVPLWGELILDRSLFLLVPAAAFAVIGFIFSFYVALNASDDWVNNSSSTPVESTLQSQPAVVNDSGCRGLCSQSEQDLEGLKNFMNRLAK